ncbi:hypothetical protein AOLI_G00220630 [Acnodon oligacanthus]
MQRDFVGECVCCLAAFNELFHSVESKVAFVERWPAVERVGHIVSPCVTEWGNGDTESLKAEEGPTTIHRALDSTCMPVLGCTEPPRAQEITSKAGQCSKAFATENTCRSAQQRPVDEG